MQNCSRPPFGTRPTYAIIVILTIENTSTGGIFAPPPPLRSITDLVYFYYWNLQFINHVIILKKHITITGSNLCYWTIYPQRIILTVVVSA